ncbi:putative transcription factor interactor and regulator CCHC(Zn) family [Medicago truncatula]|uniref:Putative transcription factor interactor and regulator CCHC(Zn) family n=1 Tax=Medicago truncatula TaxID=3880 RepID=A0A396I2Q7_MEDTR|nr:putative transcription factor interactor and regulator CCHC(Zn) family [Medicago truncatula]
MVLFGVVFNTKGNFVKDPKLRYEGGKVFAVKAQDTEFWSYFEARDIILEHDEDFDLEKVNLWWMHIDGNLEEDIKPFKDDKDAVKMSTFAADNNCDVELYVEPKDSKIDLCVLLSKGKGVVEAHVEQSNKEKVGSDVDESQYETDEDSSDDSVKDIHFDDSEEERAFCLDDGFDELVNEVSLNVSNHKCVAAPGNVHVGEIVPLVQNASDNAPKAGSDGGKMLLINNAPQQSYLGFNRKMFMSNDSFIVDLDKRTCSCNFWDLVGIPCRHAVVSIGRALETPQSYVHTYYHKKTYLDCYDQTITPINGQKMWPKTELPYILPPNYKRGPGRPKKLRRREPDEGSQGNWKRNSTTHRCKKCLKYGHNARTCKVPNLVKEKEATNGNDTNVVVTTNEGVVATVGSDTTMPSDNASLIQTQGSQTEPAPKKGRPKGSKNSKGGPKVSKVPKVPKVPKVSKGGQVSKVDKPSAEPNSNVASSVELNSNVVPSAEPNSIVAPSAEQSQGTLIDPDLFVELLFTDEVPEMLSERMVCSTPVVSKPAVMVPFVSAADAPSISEPTTLSVFFYLMMFYCNDCNFILS